MSIYILIYIIGCIVNFTISLVITFSDNKVIKVSDVISAFFLSTSSWIYPLVILCFSIWIWIDAHHIMDIELYSKIAYSDCIYKAALCYDKEEFRRRFRRYYNKAKKKGWDMERAYRKYKLEKEHNNGSKN